MSLDEFRVCVRPGDGLVARFPTSVLVVTATDWAGMPAVDGLLEECRRATAERPLPERLAELVDQAGPQAVPAFCALADDADGLALFVHGDSQVVITGAQPVMRLSGRGAGGWTSGIHDRVASLIIVPAHGSTEVAPTDDYVDLRDGIVPGSAIRLLPRQGPAQGPASSGASRVDRTDGGALPRPDRRRRAGSPAEADQPRALPATHQPAAAPQPAALKPEPEPDAPENAIPPAPTRVVTPPPIASESPNPAPMAAPAAAIDGAPAMVWGIHCKRGHFNNPDARYCRMCGTHMVHQRRDPVLGPRPLLGFLVVDDGSTYKLDADYVIGTEPDGDDAVRAGEARALSLSDPDDAVSPIHATIRLDKWDVFVADRKSRYGTHVWKPGTFGWVRLDPGQRVMLEPRTHLLFGRRTMVFDSVHRG